MRKVVSIDEWYCYRGRILIACVGLGHVLRPIFAPFAYGLKLEDRGLVMHKVAFRIPRLVGSSWYNNCAEYTTSLQPPIAEKTIPFESQPTSIPIISNKESERKGAF